jgi:ParB family chromosome partitioning protein
MTTKKKGKALPDAGGGVAVAELPPQVEVKSLGVEKINPAELVDSPLNPRTIYDEAKIAELASSMRRVGWFGTVVARPLPDGRRELAYGSRRKRGAILAGLATIDVEVRELTDEQVIALAMAENLDRSDMHPLEEADGFRRWQLTSKEACRPISVEEIAARIDRPVSFVAQRLRLGELVEEARAPFLAGKFGVGHALRIAALQPDDQRNVLEVLLRSPNQNAGEMWSVGTLSRHIEREVLRDLERAPWKLSDEELVPEAGACLPCPKRLGSTADLFPGVQKGDRCTDGVCFARKRQALIDRHIAEVRAKQEKVRDFDEATGVEKPAAGVLTLSMSSYQVHGEAKIATSLKEALEKGLPLSAAAWREQGGEKCEFMRDAVVVADGHSWQGDKTGQKKRVCAQPGCPSHDPKARAKARSAATPKEKAAAEKAKRQRLVERAEERELVGAILKVWEKKGPSAQDLLELVEHAWDDYKLEDEERADLCARRGWTWEEPKSQGIASSVPAEATKLDVVGLQVLILEIALVSRQLVPASVAKRLKIDMKTIKAAAKASVAEAATKPAPKKKAKAKR